jgi:glycosyltransferase involved in cell wall biosynthesis
LALRKLDAICAVDLDTLLPAVVWAGLRKKKLVYDAHEYFTEVPEVVGRRGVQWVWEKVAAWGIPQAHLCYTVGQRLAKELGQRYKRPFEVVRNVPFYHEVETKASARYILYQGALNEGRGLETLIAAAPRLPLPVYLAGDGDLNHQLRIMAQEIAPDRVVFLGRLSPAELRDVTLSAYIGYNLLENKGLSYYYSLANKFFDYTMAGVPCLVSPFPEYLDLHHEFHIGVVCHLEINDIVTQVQGLYKDPTKYESMRQTCLEAARALNWEREQGKLVHLYKTIWS